METVNYSEDISGAAEVIKRGGLIAVPTETVYGLAVNALDEAAVERLFAVKGRPENKPLSLMVSGVEAIDRLCADVPNAAYALAEAFWPGALTIVLKAKDGIPSAVRAGGQTVGLRCPESEKTLALLKELPFPLAVPSANPSGQASAVDITQVLEYFDGKIEGFIDGGRCALGHESTVIDMSQAPYKILRSGAVSEHNIRMALLMSLTIIGITGGTGCGKTTALNTLGDMGALVLDADDIYHELLSSSDPMRREIEARFPNKLEGDLSTKKLGELVFNDAQALSDLGAITHRFVGEEMLRRLSDWALGGNRVAAIDAIALVESGTGGMFRATVAITAPVEDRIDRLRLREGISREYAELRIKAQKTNEYFESVCDYTIENDSSEEVFRERCRQVFSDIINKDQR